MTLTMPTALYQPTYPSNPAGWEYKYYLDQIEDELPNQNYASDDDSDESHLVDELEDYIPIPRPKPTLVPIDAQRVYAANRSKEQHLKQHLQKAHEDALKEYVKENPDARNIKVRTSTQVSVKSEGTINFNAAYAAFMSCLLDRSQSLKTQKAILEYVKRDTGIQALTPNFWTISLKTFAKRALQKIVESEGLNIPLSGCSTLSDVRKACRAYFTRTKASRKTTAKVAISEGVIVINNVSHPIITTNVGGSSYDRVVVMVGTKKIPLRCDALEQLLFNKKSKN